MDESSFLSEIAKEASSQEDVILKKAEDACRGFLEEARKEADKLEKGLVHRTDLEIKKLETRAETEEALEARRGRLQLKSHYVTKAIESAKSEFDALKSDRQYPEILKKFLAELAKTIGAGGNYLVVRVSPQDEQSVRPMLHELSLKGVLQADPSLSGGVELEDEKGHFRMRNTFDSRLQKAREEVIQQLNQVLFQGIHV